MLKAVALLMVSVLAGCVKAPTIVLVDRQTALEEMVSGEHSKAHMELRQGALSPSPVPFTRSQIEAAGGQESSFDVAVRVYQSIRTDQPLIDALLVRRCLGEALDGLLVQTTESCVGEVEPAVVSTLLQRINRERRQLWVYMLSRVPSATEEEIRSAWRERHLRMVVCGAQIQLPDGTWGTKKCEEE